MAELFLTLNELEVEISKGTSLHLAEPFFDDNHNILFGTEKIITTKDVEKLKSRFNHLVSKPLRCYTVIPHFIPEEKRIKWAAYIISLFEQSELYKPLARSTRDFVEKYLKNLLSEEDYVIWKLSQVKNYSQKVFLHTANTCYISLILYFTHNHLNVSGMIDATRVQKLIRAALLHSVGMITMPKQLMEKKKIELTDAENNVYYQYPLKSYKLIESERDKHELSKETLEAVIDVEERINGTGMPRGIGGDDMSFLTRIVSIASYFELLVSHDWVYAKRPYADYIRRLRSERDRFDPHILEALEVSFKYLFKRV